LSDRIHIYQAKIVEVIDGDTFDLMVDLGFSTFTKQRMRLYGIDAPEMRTEKGKVLQINLSRQFLGGVPIIVQSVEAPKSKQFRDKYGRFLAIIYDAWPIASRPISNGDKILDVAGCSLNARLINDGLVKERYW
jgi:endonuclease YncB( thermonuclease family)